MKIKWMISTMVGLLAFSAVSGVQAAYDPNRGQWISRDPMGEQSSPLQLNLYSYVGNNPVNLADPTGFVSA